MQLRLLPPGTEKQPTPTPPRHTPGNSAHEEAVCTGLVLILSSASVFSGFTFNFKHCCDTKKIRFASFLSFPYVLQEDRQREPQRAEPKALEPHASTFSQTAAQASAPCHRGTASRAAKITNSPKGWAEPPAAFKAISQHAHVNTKANSSKNSAVSRQRRRGIALPAAGRAPGPEQNACCPTGTIGTAWQRGCYHQGKWAEDAQKPPASSRRAHTCFQPALGLTSVPAAHRPDRTRIR